MNYSNYPRPVVEDLARLRRRIEESKLPEKITDRNLLIGTWNIRAFGQVYQQWDENPGSPKRNLRAMVSIAEIIRRFDVIAIQEVKRDTTGIRMLLDTYLGDDWGMVISDVTVEGNFERLAFIYDKRRVQPSGLAGEVVLPPSDEGEPAEQFVRTPYIVGFQAGDERFSLLTVHIKYGDVPEDRLGELNALATYSSQEIRDRSKSVDVEESNLIVLGDFNIDKRGDNPLFQAFVATGLSVPPAFLGIKTTYGSEAKYYDNIAWFQGDLNLPFSDSAGVINFTGAVFKELTPKQMSYRVSDHFPLWAEFIIDRSDEQMAPTLGLDPGMPNPLDTVPD